MVYEYPAKMRSWSRIVAYYIYIYIYNDDDVHIICNHKKSKTVREKLANCFYSVHLRFLGINDLLLLLIHIASTIVATVVSK